MPDPNDDTSTAPPDSGSFDDYPELDTTPDPMLSQVIERSDPTLYYTTEHRGGYETKRTR